MFLWSRASHHATSRGYRSAVLVRLQSFSTKTSAPVLSRYESLVGEGKLKRDDKQVALATKLDRLHGLISRYHEDRINWRAEVARLEQLRKEALEQKRKQEEAQAAMNDASAGKTETKVIKLTTDREKPLQQSTASGAQSTTTKEKEEQSHESALPIIKVPRGIYVHGNVGTGKTMLMDMFLESLTVPKRRVHLHNFLQDIHARIHKKRQQTKQGAYEIIRDIGAQLAKDNVVLAFDEFFVTDIADSAILEALLDAMMHEGIVLVATSNVDPKDLLKSFNSFLPRLLAQCRVHDIESALDYREAKENEAEKTSSSASGREYHVVSNEPLTVMNNLIRAHELDVTKDLPLMCGFNRSIAIPYVWREGSESVACMTFEWLCSSKVNNFGPNEYHAICDHFDKIVIAAVPRIRIKSGRVGDQSRRFGTFMDIAYDSGIKVMTISKHVDVFFANEDDLPEDIEQNPEAQASLRSFLRARSRWKHLSRGRA